MATKTIPWDPLTGLEVHERHGALLETVFEEGDTELIVEAIRSIACARGMSELADLAGISREEMFEAFKKGGSPDYCALEKVIGALGFQMPDRKAAA